MPGIPWAKSEDAILKKCLEKGLSYEQVQEVLISRSEDACRARARSLRIERKLPEPEINLQRLEELLSLKEAI